jgi:hypothetical protein
MNKTKRFKAGDLVTFDLEAQSNRSYPLDDFENWENAIGIFIDYETDDSWSANCTVYFVDRQQFLSLYFDRFKLYE